MRVRTREAFCIGHSRAHTRTHVNLELQSVTAKGLLGLPSQHANFSVLNKTGRSTRAHRRVTVVKRARSRTWLLALPIVGSIHQNSCELGNLIGHRQRFTWTSKPTWQPLYSEQFRKLYARAQAGDHGHPRASAIVDVFVGSALQNIQQNPCYLGNPIGNLQVNTVNSRPTLRFSYT